jgi:hypothetical protein
VTNAQAYPAVASQMTDESIVARIPSCLELHDPVILFLLLFFFYGFSTFGLLNLLRNLVEKL